MYVCAGEPWEIKKAVCLHEEDAGILWKHMEYRNGARLIRRLPVMATIPSVTAIPAPLLICSSAMHADLINNRVIYCSLAPLVAYCVSSHVGRSLREGSGFLRMGAAAHVQATARCGAAAA